MYTIRFSNAFKKSYKRAISRGLDIGLLDEAVSILKRQGHLPDKYHPHPLHGYNGLWECHIQPDWLLLWRKNKKELTILLIDTGSHTDLFGH